MQTRPAMGFGYKEELLRLGGNCSKDVLPWARARKIDSFENKESLQTRPAMYLGYKERLLRKDGITPDTSCHGPGLSRATPSKGKNQSKDVLPWAWAIKSDSFKRKESLRIRPAMGLGFKERRPRREGINPNTSCHGLGL